MSALWNRWLTETCPGHKLAEHTLQEYSQQEIHLLVLPSIRLNKRLQNFSHIPSRISFVRTHRPQYQKKCWVDKKTHASKHDHLGLRHLDVIRSQLLVFTYPTLSSSRIWSACCLASNKFRSLHLCTSWFQSVASHTAPYSPSPTMKSPRTWPNRRNLYKSCIQRKCKHTYQPKGPPGQDGSSDGMLAWDQQGEQARSMPRDWIVRRDVDDLNWLWEATSTVKPGRAYLGLGAHHHKNLPGHQRPISISV